MEPMRYYYRLGEDPQWRGPYEDGRQCIYDAAFAGQQASSSAQAIVISDDRNPDELTDKDFQLFEVPTKNLAGDIKHPMYEPPSEWVNAQQLGGGTESPDPSGSVAD
jgi:hypothetical protein